VSRQSYAANDSLKRLKILTLHIAEKKSLIYQHAIGGIGENRGNFSNKVEIGIRNFWTM